MTFKYVFPELLSSQLQTKHRLGNSLPAETHANEVCEERQNILMLHTH